MTNLRNRIDARAAEVAKAGFLGHWTVIKGDEFFVGTRASCGALLHIPLTGPIPRCSETCTCTADAKRRAKSRRAG